MALVSVCMTTYNGEQFIREQLMTILSQLRTGDEVVICDDSSTDSTVDIICSFNDPRIRLLVNTKNLGFSRNFTKCISLSRNDVIFICDQDDVWLPNKVEKYLKIFRENPDVVAVMSNMEIIDGVGQVTSDRFLNLRSGYGNRLIRVLRYYVKSTYYGCSMAFRSELCDKVLPLPFHFDTWIGLVSDMYGHCYHLDEVTMQYRRHGGNFSTMKTFPIRTIIKWRFNLLLNLLTLILGIRKKMVKYSFLSLLDV
jgi:glycosyltransferase involved in cell wall biosynthesis